MKRTLSLIMTVLVVFSAFALWTLPASAAAEIVQDGLVSWYDGDDYEGTTWTDKKGDNDITDCVDGTFKDGAYVLDKAQQALPNALYDVIRGDEFTVELNLGAFNTYPDTGYATWMCNNSGTTAEKVSFYIQLNKGSMDTFKAKTSGIGSSARPAFDNATETLQNATLTITFKAGEKTNVYVNGVLTASATSPAANANADVGSNPKFILGNAGSNNWSNTAFEGMRFYSRALTADEVKNNADVDNAPAVEGPTEITISPYDPDTLKGFENWSGQTQLLVCTTEDVPMDYVWELTIKNDATGVEKTITLVASTGYDTWLRRFEVCLGEGENQFVPENGAAYTVSAKIYDTEGNLAMVAAEASGFVCGLDPIVPSVDTVGALTIAPKYDSIGNWRNYTWFIVGYSCDIDSNGNINDKLKDGTYTLKVVITDETGKTHTISKYAFDHVDEDWGAVGATHWGHDGSYLRICASDYGIAPSADHTYTVTFEIYEGETLKHAGTSAEGAFGVNPDNGNSVAWQENGAIVLDNPPYLYDEAQQPVDPPVDPPVEPPVEPPVTGDATAIIAVLALVALFGAAIVTKKAFVK